MNAETRGRWLAGKLTKTLDELLLEGVSRGHPACGKRRHHTERLRDILEWANSRVRRKLVMARSRINWSVLSGEIEVGPGLNATGKLMAALSNWPGQLELW